MAPFAPNWTVSQNAVRRTRVSARAARLLGVAHRYAGADGGEDAGAAKALGQKIGAEGDEQAQQHL